MKRLTTGVRIFCARSRTLCSYGFISRAVEKTNLLKLQFLSNRYVYKDEGLPMIP